MQNEILEGFRLSPQQERLWLLQPAGPGYRVQCALLIEGPLQTELLSTGLMQIINRHEILRTAFECISGMEMPLQIIKEHVALSYEEIDFSGWDAQEQEAALEQHYCVLRKRNFDLKRGQLMHGSLLRMSANKHVLMLSLSALCADIWTLRNLVREVGEFLAHSDARREAVEEPVQYVQFSEWLNDIVESEDGIEGREFWQRQEVLADSIIRLPFETPIEGVYSDIHAEPEPKTHVVTLGGEIVAQLQTLATAQNVSLSMLLLTLWQTLLWRLTGQDNISVETAFNGRTFEEMYGALGACSRWLSVTTRFEDRLSFSDILRSVSDALVGAGEQQDFFIPKRIQEGNGQLEKALNAIGFEHEQWPASPALSDLSLTVLKVDSWTERFKLKLTCLFRENELDVKFSFDSQVYSDDVIARLSGQYRTMLQTVAGNVHTPVCELEILGDYERFQVLEQWNETATPLPSSLCLPQLFRQQVERTPQRTALVCGQEQLSYAELNARANQLAHLLRQRGVQRESLVGIFMERSVGMMVAVLGVLKAGAAYLPLEVAYPWERLKFMVADAGARVVLTQASECGRMAGLAGVEVIVMEEVSEELAAQSEAEVEAEVEADDLAYVIYTSGSTGTPKAVMVQHHSISNLANALQDCIYAHHPEALRVSLNAPLTFDASVKQIIQLLSGHTLCVIPEDVRLDAEEMLRYLREQSIDVLDCTPSQLRVLMDAAGEPGLDGRLKAALIGGEAIEKTLWEKLAASKTTRFYNVYGPTECTVDSTVCRIEAERPVIGRPIPNAQIYLLTSALRPVPIGVEGEICIGGRGLARGYLKRPELTAEKFIPNPFSESGARLYSTGDTGRYLPDGTIEFIGRADGQLKLRGFRIELGEIEAVLARHAGIKDAVVLALDDEAGYKYLAAYLVSNSRYASFTEDRPRYQLPNGIAIVQQNKNETDYLYEELFVKQCYIRHGITLPERGCIFDVGANIGMFTLLVSQHRPDARIYAFEPIASIYDTLRINTSLYCPNAKLFPIGLSREEKTETFTYYPRYSMMSGLTEYANETDEIEVIKRYLRNEKESSAAEMGSLLEDADEILAGRFAVELCESRLRRLSDVMREEKIERIDLLKIDVQRAELDVLEGINDADWRKIQQVVMEVHDGKGQQTEGRIEKITQLLQGQNFEVIVEQDELLVGTDRFSLYARRIDESEDEAGNRRSSAEQNRLPVIEVHELSLSSNELREYMRDQLPEYMVPAVVVMLDEMPLTRHGKIDRKALPSPEHLRTSEAEQIAAPRSPHEEILSGLWAEVLNREVVSRDANFFELGGHSLLATQLISRIRELFRIELPLRTLFESPTVVTLSERIETSIKAGDGLAAPPIQPATRDSEMPLSFAQQRLWFLDQLEPNNSVYNCPGAVRLTGRLDIAVLEKTLTEIVRRHEILRTSFLTSGGSAAQVISPARPQHMPIVDLTELNEEGREAIAQHLAREEAQTPFDLARGPLLRTMLLQLGQNEHIILFTLHHIIADAWSFSVLVSEVAALYEAFYDEKPSPLPELDIQYADYAAWQQRWLNGEVLKRQICFWKEELAGSTPFLKLPTDYPRSAVPTYQGSSQSFALTATTSESLKALCRQEGVTLFMALLAAFQLLLARYSGQFDINVGTAIAGRNWREIEGLIGFFINTLVLRTNLSGNPTFKELLTRVRQVCLSAYAHQDLPFERLVEELQPERSLSHTPLFQTMLNLHNVPQQSLQLPGLTIGAREIIYEKAKFDLTLSISESEQGISGSFIYNTALFDAATIRRMADHFKVMLGSIVANPQQAILDIPMLSEVERRQALFDWNDTSSPRPEDICYHHLFEQQVQCTPEATALRFEEQQLSYAELNARANQLANHLLESGLAPETRVGIYVEPSLEMMVAVLGILKAGGAYVGLDPALPRERFAFILEDAQVQMLLTQQRLLHSLPANEARVICLDTDWSEIAQRGEQSPSHTVLAEQLAYIIYTSGSTGVPKGVCIEHRQLVNYVNAILDRLNLPAATSFATVSTLAADLGNTAIFPALCVGGTLHIVSWQRISDPLALADYFRRHQNHCLKITPSHLKALLASPESEDLLPCQRLILGGESLSWELVEQVRQLVPECEVINHYGPTETTVGVLTYALEQSREAIRSTRPPIGRPLANTQAYILDERMEPVPVGVTGELYIGGAGLARGYLDRAAQTAEQFIPHPYSDRGGERLYRTGDLARYLSDGKVEYLGRMDHQVKVRGYRVELEEVEAVLNHHQDISAAVVLAHEGNDGDQRLVAYVSRSGQESLQTDELRQYLRKKLPEYMIPQTFMYLVDLPRTAQGKINRQALPVPDSNPPELKGAYRAPITPTEERLVVIWGSLLRVERIGVDDNFFDLGGHSLLAMQVISRMRELFRLELPLRKLFERPSIARLAQLIDDEKDAEPKVTGAGIIAASREAHRAKLSSLDE
jgi:amino acid adenylation domain-containing protein/FkbM family methyltransferase